MTCTEAVIKRIKKLYKERKWSINHTAEMADISQTTLSNLVRGKNKNPKLDTLYKIAGGFGMTLSEFMDFPEMNETLLITEKEDRKKVEKE